MQHARGPAAHSITPTLGSVPRARSSSQRAFAVYLGPVGFAVAWACLYLFHAVCALYCFAAAALFRVTQLSLMVEIFDGSGAILSPAFFPAVAVVHYLIGAVHAGFLVAPLVRVVYHVLTDRYHSGPSSRTDSVVVKRIKSVAQLPKAIEKYIPVLLRGAARGLYARVFAREGLLGIESRQFDALLLAREALECGLQTYQAYQMCQSLPRRGLNRLFVATLVVNCWVTPVLHRFVAHKPLQRLLDRLCDVSLDFLAAVGVPVVVVASYWPMYNPANLTFLTEYWNDALWVAKARTESPLVFFGSWLDALSRLVFSIGLLLSLDDIKTLLRRRRVVLSAVNPNSSGPTLDTKTTAGGRALRLGHAGLCALGVAVLAVHAHSELRARPKACLLELNPWFEPKPTCVAVEFSCYADRALSGSAHDFDDVFGNLNAAALEQIRFRHCPSIHVRPSIRQFRNVVSLRFYNSTIFAWGADAALSNTTHPKLGELYLMRTNLTDGALPDGLLAHDFPRSVIDVVFSVTNVAHIPDDLDERWPPGISLCVEFSRLTQYPPAFARLQAAVIALTGNLITHVPAEAFDAVTDQMSLVLSGNPITSLPEDVAFAGGIYAILLDSTNLTTVPAWLLDAATTMGTYVTAGRSPYCERVLADDALLDARSHADASSEEEEEDASWSSSEDRASEATPFWPVDCTDTGIPFGAYGTRFEARANEVW